MSNNIQVNSEHSVSFAEAPQKGVLAKDIATRARSTDFTSSGLYLPNPDPVLKKQGKDIAIYKELRSDAHVKADIIKRKAKITSQEWEVQKKDASDRVHETVKEVFNKLHMHSVLGEMLNASLFGYQPVEVMWAERGGQLLPGSLVGKPPEWFVFDNDGNLRFQTKDKPTEGEELPPRKFLVVQNDADYLNPYGDPALSGCFWPVTFKRGGLKFWLMFTEKYGSPFIVGKYARGTSQSEIDKLADRLEDMIQDAVAAIPDDSSVEIKEAGGKAASAEIYERLLDFCNAEISKAIVGQTLTTEIGDTGSYAASKTHGDVLQDIVDADSRMVEQAMNQLIRWIVEINFGEGEPLPEFRLYQPEEVGKDQADRDKTLNEGLASSGKRLSADYWKRTYNLADEDLEDAATPPAQPPAPGPTPQFMENRATLFDEQDEVDQLIEYLDNPDVTQKQAEQMLRPVMQMINGAASFEQVLNTLAEQYPEMTSSQLEEKLSRAIFVAEVFGRLSEEQQS